MSYFNSYHKQQGQKKQFNPYPVNHKLLENHGAFKYSYGHWGFKKVENHCPTTFCFSKGLINSKQQEFFCSSDFGPAGMGTDCKHRVFPLFPIWMGDVCDCLLLASHPLPLHHQPGQWKNTSHSLDQSGGCTSIQLVDSSLQSCD